MSKLQSLRNSYRGRIFKTNQGCTATIVEYIRRNNVIITFDEGILIKCSIGNLVKGAVINPFYPSVCGVGYLGIGKYFSSKNKIKDYKYVVWSDLLRRCYSKKFQERHPTYIGCSVCEEWHNFQNFAQWFEESYNPEIMEGWELDKDILVKSNKVYSPETCCFVPKEINTIFGSRRNKRGLYLIGVRFQNNKYLARVRVNNIERQIGIFNTEIEAFQAYKVAKEEYIKEVAEKWRGKITEETYQALINYIIEITD